MKTLMRLALPSIVLGSAVLWPGGPAFAIGESLQERGRTVGIVDGDTILVDIWGDGTGTARRVRFTGVNSNEPGQCHAADATSRTRDLALGRVVHLLAIDKGSRSQGRLRRTVLARQPDGTFRNLARTLVSESLANASPLADEWGRNSEYRQIQDREMAQGQRIWNRAACRVGPQQGHPIRVHVHWQGGVGSEYVDITNNSATSALNLGGWRVRNTSPFHYTFAAGTSVPPGATLRVRVGSGTDTALVKFWPSTEARFLNATTDQRAIGNAAFLVDGDIDIRTWDVYL